MNCIKLKVIKIVTSFFAIAFITSTPVIASELLSDLYNRMYDDTCRSTNNAEQRRLCQEYGDIYTNEKRSPTRNLRFEDWYIECEEQYIGSGTYGGCSCSEATLPARLKYRVRNNKLGSQILRDCQYWICKNDSTVEERMVGTRTYWEEVCLPFASLIEYTRNAELSSGDPDSGVEGRNATFVVGTWKLNANGWTGKLKIHESNGKLNGRIWFDAHKKWENLTQVKYDGKELHFFRPEPNQYYVGKVNNNRTKGTFTYKGSSYSWSANR